ncbi:leucine-rich repeat domain-containing protein, partial [Bacteroidales bacterium OttesenSCG-928-I21]|nr:leucine-rich repeat domain-containing protein [Bacteroidales bacterium OttesenSCG-928-I21]
MKKLTLLLTSLLFCIASFAQVPCGQIIMQETFTDVNWEINSCGASKYADIPKTGNISKDYEYADVYDCSTNDTPYIHDGQYAVIKESWDGGWWKSNNHSNVLEHTGDGGGMLLVNAAMASIDDYFYEFELSNLLPNNNYEFSVWLASAGAVGYEIPPNVKLQVTDDSQNMLEEKITGELLDNSWHQFKLAFTTPDTNSKYYRFRLVNMVGIGGAGNDVLIDDIMVTTCEARIDYDFSVGNDSIMSFCPGDMHMLVGTAENIEAYAWYKAGEIPPAKDKAVSATDTYTMDFLTVEPEEDGDIWYFRAFKDDLYLDQKFSFVQKPQLSFHLSDIPKHIAVNAKKIIQAYSNFYDIQYSWNGENYGFESYYALPTSKEGDYTIIVKGKLEGYCDAEVITGYTVTSKLEVPYSNLFWEMQGDTLIISGQGDMPDFDGSFLPWSEYINDIKSLIVDDGVTSIGREAFSGLYNLQSILYMSKSVTKIGYSAFSGCSSLETVTIPIYVTEIGTIAFAGCENLQTVNFDAINCFSNDGWFFRNCLSLTTVNIGESVTRIPSFAFSECSSLTTITISASVKEIEYHAFSDCKNLKNIYAEGLTAPFILDSYAFPGVNKKECNLIIPYGSTGYIEGEWAEFNVMYPDGNKPLMPIPNSNLFWEIKGDTLIISGQGSMPNYDYYYYYAPWREYRNDIKYLAVNDGVTSIGKNAFLDLYNLQSILYISKSVTKIDDNAFWNCSSLETVTIPENITEMGYQVFADCENLQTVNFDAINCVTLDNGDFFSNCSSLTTVNIGQSVTRIPDLAFFVCPLLTEITIPSSVIEIGHETFAGCSGLKNIYAEGFTAPI